MPRSSTETRSIPIAVEAEAPVYRELANYFGRRSDLPHREDWRETVAAVLAVLPAYHRGVLALHHAGRAWPKPIDKAFGAFASLAIRLDCCDHPASGSTSALEAAAAERLAAVIAAEGPDSATVAYLWLRATDHFDSAVHAYATARLQHSKAGPAAAMDQAAE
jgi:hypothetical protein